MKVTVSYFDDKLKEYDIECEKAHINVEFDYIHITHKDGSEEWINYNKLFGARIYK